jgi:hypothetical protein
MTDRDRFLSLIKKPDIFKKRLNCLRGGSFQDFDFTAGREVFRDRVY